MIKPMKEADRTSFRVSQYTWRDCGDWQKLDGKFIRESELWVYQFCFLGVVLYALISIRGTNVSLGIWTLTRGDIEIMLSL
jgi:hypothetical protein